MAHVDQLWAGWRQDYVVKASNDSRERRSGTDVPVCILCELENEGADHYVIARNEYCYAVMNLYPYSNGHLMVVPRTHHQDLNQFSKEVRLALIEMTNSATEVLQKVYDPDGINIGVNMGEAAGAGIPGHLHVHVLPRWNADTNFVSTIANTRVLPETIDSSYQRINQHWPESERI